MKKHVYPLRMILTQMLPLACLILLTCICQAQTAKQVAANPIASGDIVFTYKITPSTKGITAHSDESPSNEKMPLLDDFLAELKKIKGITRATFDHATYTVTIIGSKDTKLDRFIDLKYFTKKSSTKIDEDSISK